MYKKAFTILELTVVLAILSILAFPMIGSLSSFDRINKYDQTRDKIQKIQAALNIYYKSNPGTNILPCPTDISLPISNGSVGNASCSDQAVDASGQIIYYGGIPVDDLGLSQEYIIDAWGNKLSYYISADITNSALSDGYINVNNYNLVDSSGSPLTETDIAYVIISHGEDGIGSYNLSGTQIGTSSNASSMEQLNIYSSSKVISPSQAISLSKGDIKDIAFAVKKNDIIIQFIADTSNAGRISLEDILILNTDSSYLGINNVAPAYSLDVTGDMNVSADIMLDNLYATTSIAVANTTPAYELDVTGDSRVTGNFYIGTNLGIADTSASAELDVTGDANFTATLEAGYLSGDGSNLTNISAGSSIWSSSSDGLYYSSGNVGIKNSSPSYDLDITGDINFTGTLNTAYLNGDGSGISGVSSSSAVWSSSGSNLYYNSGDVGIGTSSPSYDLDLSSTGELRADIVTYISSSDDSKIDPAVTTDLYKIYVDSMYDFDYPASYYADPSGTSQFNVINKSSGSFDIPHPDPAKIAENENYRLRHYFVETPSAGGNIYKFQKILKKGFNSFKLDNYFKYLNKDALVWVNPYKHFGIAYGKVNEINNSYEITADIDGLYNIFIFADRKDELAMKEFNKFGIEYILEDQPGNISIKEEL